MIIIQVLSFKREEMVRNCQILTIFDHLSILMHLSITWPSLWCEWSYWFHFLFTSRPLASTFNDLESLASAVNTLVAKWRFTATSPKLGDRIIFSFQQPWASCLEKCGFFSWCNSVYPAIKQDQDDHYSVAELQTRRNGEKLSNFDHIWPPVNFNAPLYNMTQLWCDWSYWFHFFCLVLGRWHPHSMT